MIDTVAKFLAAQGIVDKATTEKAARDPIRDAELREELTQVKKDIDVWDAAISQNQIEMELEKAKASQFRYENRPFMADASEKNVDVLASSLQSREKERAQSAERRKEIEDLLR